MRNSLLIENDGMIQKVLRQDIREVYIDTGMGLDVLVASPPEKTVVEEHPREITVAGPKVIVPATFEEKLAAIKPIEVGDEVPAAIKIREKAESVLEEVFAEVLAGRKPDIAAARHVSEEMVESAMRNADALPVVAKVREREKYLRARSLNVSSLMIAFSKFLGIDPHEMVEIATGSLLHDIGMLKVSEQILESGRKLTAEEFNEVKKHVAYSYDMLLGTPGVSKTILQVAALHHERQDGSGYPRGLRGEQIPPVVRMIGIVDIYDAITTPRAYGEKIQLTQANKKLLEIASLEQIDEKLTQAFISLMGIYPVGMIVRLASGKIGVVVKQNPESLLKPVVRVVYDGKRGCFVRPRDIDLLHQQDERSEEKIVAPDSENKLEIDPINFISSKLASF
jgi:HD-GYP domain-containing protein (c-di-GMP phosphodiesterase class II)